MGLDISIRERQGVTILDLRGRIVLGDGVDQVIDAVKKFLEQGKTNLLIDLAGVTKVDSCGLGALVASYTSAARQSSELKLLHPPKHVTDLFKITKLCTVFEIFDGEDSAIESFSKETPARPPESHLPAAQQKVATNSR